MLVTPELDSAEPIALFVFVPFCKIKCTYCDFNAYAHLSRLMEPYQRAVVQEIEMVAAQIPLQRVAKTLYLGGGTPSLVPASHVRAIVEASRTHFSFAQAAEITLEVNPGTVDAQKLDQYREMGINRLSIGVQSFDDVTVRRLNRGHTVANALEAFNLTREAGFGNVSLDLIYGLPLQTMLGWQTSLQRAIDLRPEHLSLYALKVEQGTGLDYQIRRGVYAPPDDDLAADMYLMADELLEQAGYVHYEISNWARIDTRTTYTSAVSSRWRSKHNLTYWKYEPYIGFGAGAHSFFNNTRYWNLAAPAKYIEAVASGEKVVEGSEEISNELQMAESVILALRLDEGLRFDWFHARFGEQARTKYASQFKHIQEMGLGEVTDEGITLNERGRLVSNEVFWRFLP